MCRARWNRALDLLISPRKEQDKSSAFTQCPLYTNYMSPTVHNGPNSGQQKSIDTYNPAGMSPKLGYTISMFHL